MRIRLRGLRFSGFALGLRAQGSGFEDLGLGPLGFY